MTATTVAAVQYDSGASGPCAIVFVNCFSELMRNSLVSIGGEVIRILEVVPAPNTTNFSVRCSTVGTVNVGDAVTGLLSWYAYTTSTHMAGESITSNYVSLTQSAAGVGAAQLAVAVDASSVNFRPISSSDDYMHISIYMDNPQNVSNVQVLMSLDPTPDYSFTNPGNSYIWTLTGNQLNLAGASGNSWVEVVVPISAAKRSGDDLTRTLANISGVAVQMTSIGACNYGFDWWYLFGTYGQVIQPNSPVGVVYAQRFRDSSTGAHSVPGPQTRYQLFPLREAVIITPVTTTAVAVDTIDLYRQGGSVTAPLYVASLINDVPSPFAYVDALPDITVLGTNQPPDLTAIQPWAIQQPPKSGTANVVGTSVYLQSGNSFDLNLLGNTVITINGTAYLTYGSPRSAAFLELQQDAGNLSGTYITIDNPVLAGQPLPFAFGPLEGPFAPVVFGLGDPINGGLLYFTNLNDADSAADTNTVELSTPSSDLVSGAVWNGLCIAGSRDSIYCVRYTYLSAIASGGTTNYQWATIPTPSGFWSRWSVCSTPVGVISLGRDGIYLTTDVGSVNISDERLYPLFPHDGQAATPVLLGRDTVYPVDMTQLDSLRMSYCDECIRFCYKDTVGNYNTLTYPIYKKRWFINNYADGITLHYLVEKAGVSDNNPDILMLSANNVGIMLEGGDTDNGKDINSILLLPSMDGGDQRSQKLYVDTMVMLDSGTGTVQYLASYNNSQITSPASVLLSGSGIRQRLVNIASLGNLALYRNIGARFAWIGGPNGPKLYAWEVSGYVQPYLATSMVIQFSPFSFPGWKHMRRLYPALISAVPVFLTIETQDGRTYGPYTIPPTGSTYRILPQMLDSGIKDLAFALQLATGNTVPFAPFLSDFTAEVKEWTESTYIKLAIFKA